MFDTSVWPKWDPESGENFWSKMVCRLRLPGERSIYFSISRHTHPDFTNERKHHLVYDADNFFWIFSIQKSKNALTLAITDDCPVSKQEIIQSVEHLSGENLSELVLNEMKMEAGHRLEIRQLMILRHLTLGEVRELPTVEKLKSLFLYSAIVNENSFGFNDCWKKFSYNCSKFWFVLRIVLQEELFIMFSRMNNFCVCFANISSKCSQYREHFIKMFSI